jgi:hypothetical protein
LTDKRDIAMKVTQHLWFEKGMEAAIGFYTSLVRGSPVDWISALPADTPSGPAGSVKIAAFTLGDQHYMAIEAGPLDPVQPQLLDHGRMRHPGRDRSPVRRVEGGRTDRAMRLGAGPLGPLLAD